MKSILTTLALTLAFAPLPSRAQSEASPENAPVIQEIASGTTLRLLGRGVQNRETGDSIALACFDEGCKQLRFVYFRDQKAEFRGDPIRMPEYVGDGDAREARRLVAKALAVQIENFFMIRTPNFYAKERKSYIRSQYVVAILGAPFFFISPWAGGAALLTLSVGWNVWHFAAPNSMVATLGGTGFSSITVSKAAHDQEGWNWSANPRRKSAAKFEEILKALTYTAYAEYREWMNNVGDRKYKLYRKGIRFRDGSTHHLSGIRSKQPPTYEDPVTPM